MKSVVVTVAGTGEGHDLTIEPGTTSQDILNQLGLKGYVLAKDNGRHVLGANENVYVAAQDGEKLIATAEITVAYQRVSPANRPASAGLFKDFWTVVQSMAGKTAEHLPLASSTSGTLRRGSPIVKRGFRPLWEEREWRRNGPEYSGYFRTPYGAYEGRILEYGPDFRKFFIINPPNCLWRHSHRQCFLRKGDNTYEVHFSTQGKTIDDGIIPVENVLIEAHEGRNCSRD